MVSKEEFEKWKNGGLVLSYNTFITPEELEKIKIEYKKEAIKRGIVDENEINDYIEDCMLDDGTCSYTQYTDDEYLEYFEEEHTTKSGDVVVAFGKYGHD
jgi:hypothetical protein